MKTSIKNIRTAFAAAGSTTLLAWSSMTAMPMYSAAAQAEGANHCVILRNRDYGSGQELYNRCNGELEVTWCLSSENGCSRFNNTWTLGPGESYPVGSGYVEWSACAGANSLRHGGPKTVYCD